MRAGYGHDTKPAFRKAPGKPYPPAWRSRDDAFGGKPMDAESLLAAESAVGNFIRIVGIAIDAFGVAVIVAGIAWSTWIFLRRRMQEEHYDAYKIRIGRSLLLGLEILVAADIVKTIALEPSFTSLGVLGGLVVVRTFLGWTLVLEIEGRWPWQTERHRAEAAAEDIAQPSTAAAVPALRRRH
jgi:uncharacterized membrane protein